MLNKPIPLGSLTLDNDSLMQFNVNSQIERRDGNFDGNIVIRDTDKAVVAEVPLSMQFAPGVI